MNDKKWILVFSAWVLAVIATLGSLFFSEVMKLPPCILCWYQRICMYPLVIILFAGLFPYEGKVVRFSLPLVLTGWVIAFYHNLLYYNILPESASPCVQGISCTTVQLNWLGFITIPLLSFTSFTLISLILIFTNKANREK